MKKFLKLMSFILVFSFLWIINTKSAQAGFSISVPKTITMYYGQMKKITPKLYYNGEFMKNDATLWKHYGDEEGGYTLDVDSISWSRSNKNISLDSYEGIGIEDLYTYVDAKKFGKSKITLSIDCYEDHFAVYDDYRYGEDGNYDDNLNNHIIKNAWDKTTTIKKTISVIVKPYKSIHMNGWLYKYDTRSNIFKTKLFNASNKKIRIYSKGAYFLDCDYKKYDRNLKLTGNKKYIDLKPGKWTKVNFKIKGSLTWWDIRDEEIHCNCKIGNKKYVLCIDDEEVCKWSKGKWRNIGAY